MLSKWREFSESIDVSVRQLVKQERVQVLFPHWKEKYPDQFGPGTEYEKAHKISTSSISRIFDFNRHGVAFETFER